MSRIEFSPSLMTMDLDKFKEQITFLNDKVASYHIDIMDGHFVPNITLSPWFIQEVQKISDTPLSVHLMVTDPTFWVDQVLDLQCEYICIHAEVLNGLAFRLIDKIHDAGLKAGVVLNPETPVSTIFPYIDLLDKVTIIPNHSYLSQLDVTYKTPDLMSHFLPPHEVSFTFCCSSIVFPR